MLSNYSGILDSSVCAQKVDGHKKRYLLAIPKFVTDLFSSFFSVKSVMGCRPRSLRDSSTSDRQQRQNRHRRQGKKNKIFETKFGYLKNE